MKTRFLNDLVDIDYLFVFVLVMLSALFLTVIKGIISNLYENRDKENEYEDNKMNLYFYLLLLFIAGTILIFFDDKRILNFLEEVYKNVYICNKF